jgi:hypothetical protein
MPSVDYEAHRAAVRRRVCAVCLDTDADGACRRTLRGECALRDRLPLVVDTVRAVRCDRMDEYVAAVERAICSGCASQDGVGRCLRREEGACTLHAFLPLVVDVVEELRDEGVAALEIDG